jgi:hypothetical protein
VIFVYGSEKEMWRACGGVVVLRELDVSRIPRGAILYTDLPLRTAAKIKLKAPWIKVRTGGVEVVDVQLFELDAAELMRDIKEWGTCQVYVPDDAVRQALERLPHRLIISFKERCEGSYPCSWYKKLIEDSLRQAVSEAHYSRPYEDVRSPRPLRTIPTSTYARGVLKPPTACTAVGSPLFDIDWDYYLDYPPATTPEELATALREGRLKLQKAVPKLKTIKNPCPENSWPTHG